MDDRDVKIVRGIFRRIDNMMRVADDRIAGTSRTSTDE
jgi:hypothetical protein